MSGSRPVIEYFLRNSFTIQALLNMPGGIPAKRIFFLFGQAAFNILAVRYIRAWDLFFNGIPCPPDFFYITDLLIVNSAVV